MTTFSITAHFPLGVFLGHKSDGSPDPFPDTARLFSALVNAAGQGELAVEENGQLRISAESETALRWLETNPPSALTIPKYQPLKANDRPDRYRDEGTVEKRAVKKRESKTSTGSALGGTFGWQWVNVPPEIARTLEQLCHDVPCLGEADSPVILSVGTTSITHTWNKKASQLRNSGLSVRSPMAGRFAALEDAWLKAYPAKRPSAASDKVSFSEKAAGPPIPTEGLQMLSYIPVQQQPSPAPWPKAYLVPVSGEILPQDAVSWCVAAHRWLAATIRTTAPSSITGDYPPGTIKPANRLSIQYLPKHWVAHLEQADALPHGALAFLLPHGLSPRDEKQILGVLEGQKQTLWRWDGTAKVKLSLGKPIEVNLETFWPEVREGWVRTWTSPFGLVNETRRQPDDPELGPWTFREAALLSVTNLFRNQLDETNHLNYWMKVRAAKEVVTVISTRRLPDSSLGRFIHKVPSSLGVVQPYTATLDLGTLTNNRTLLALGQSRHLGGGLLVPVDTPEPL